MRNLALACVLALGMGAAVSTGRPPEKVGVVDLGSVFEKYAKWADMRKLMLDRMDIKQKEVAALAKETEALEAKLEDLDPASQDFVKTQGLLIKKRALAETMARQYDLELERSEEIQYEGVAEEVGGVISELAKEQGLAIVVQRVMALPEGVVWESVLYADPRLDLTEQVAERLNARYAREKP